ncbi:integrase domain-containing protein [Alcaligenes nematophilus]|uniref:phage integrase N-terminal domain-containing protein n=1 Tax=Alcaligenes TaxID=507 RepID=UPI001EE4756C|nr:phage integrase N-terminal domain-containing protein [Alcaligenes faecalis]
MDDLTYTLRQLCLRNRDGSHATQADRQRSLSLAAHQLREAGFRQMRATSLKGKHVEALLQRWQAEGLLTGTLKNRMAHLRWWAEKVGKAGILPADNTKLGILERRYVTNESKAKELGDRLDRVADIHVRMSLRLQAAFGLRREESIKFQPRYADRGDDIAIKGSWAKGGRDRTVPITMPEQRAVLDEAHRLPVFSLLCRSHFQTGDPAQFCISQIRFPHASGQVSQKSCRCSVALSVHQIRGRRSSRLDQSSMLMGILRRARSSASSR